MNCHYLRECLIHLAEQDLMFGTFGTVLLFSFPGAVPKAPKADELRFKTKPDGYVSIDSDVLNSEC